MQAAAAQMENRRWKDGEKSPAQRGAVAAEMECLSMERAEGIDRSPGRIYGLAGGLGLS